MTRVFRPVVEQWNVPVRAPHPLAVRLASVLGNLHGRGIDGDTGTIIIGEPANGTRNKYGGYLNPQQAFAGWNPRKVAGGSIRVGGGALPGNGQGPNPVLDVIMNAGGRQ